MKNKHSAIDKMIEQEYYRQATGRQISVLDIPKLVSVARRLIEQGALVSDAVATGINLYCKPVEERATV